MAQYNLFMVGGAKGVGKTTLTLDVSARLRLKRIETGKLVLNYVSKGLPLEHLTEYIVTEILSHNTALVLDTHYARYADYEEPNKQFSRGLESQDLIRLLTSFDVFPCLVEVPPSQLEERRREDLKKRIINPVYIAQELEFNRRGYALYLKEANRLPFILMNDDYTTARDHLMRWIVQNNGGSLSS